MTEFISNSKVSDVGHIEDINDYQHYKTAQSKVIKTHSITANLFKHTV